MNPAQRDTLAHGVIAATLLVGCYMLFVDRLQRQLSLAQGQVAVLTAQVRDSEQLRDHVPEMTDALRSAEALAQDIRRRSELSGDDRKMHTALSDLARRFNVRIDELNPVAPSARPVIEASAKLPAVPVETPASDVEHAVAFSMVASASFSSISELMRAIQSELGYSVIKNARIVPAPDQPGMVRATIVTEHYAFDVTPRTGTAPQGDVPRE